MLYLVCGLTGVLVGGLLTLIVCLSLLRRRGDRDLIERRLRAYLEYRERLGDVGVILERASDTREEDTALLRQAEKNIAGFCREFRLTCWLLPDAERETLGRIVTAFEREAESDAATGSLLARTLERQRTVDRLLRRAVEREIRAYRRFRLRSEHDTPTAPDVTKD